ncbi:BLUF domain-containing protein [Marinicella sediminis]|uniref:BLUF domain-containing protein n=1 Tax=Marinicella sediminis TaxID=1792834 RepID=A0ABV7JAX1_9GAMM|nr:BLUF domain-containing protein [Marinicella sediminis]
MEQLLRMVYVSESTQPLSGLGGEVPIEIGRILMQSRKNNPKLEVGGVLYFRNNYFFQCLEGEQDVVNDLYQKIATDPRHKQVQTLSVKRIHQRQFSDWSMKYVASKDQVNRLIRQFGMQEFNPYQFDDYMIDELLKVFNKSSDQTSQPDQSYSHQPNPDRQSKGLFSRLFGRR